MAKLPLSAQADAECRRGEGAVSRCGRQLHSASDAHLTCQATGPGNVRHFGWLRLAPFWWNYMVGKSMAEQIAGSLGSEPLARARQLFHGLPKATCQATCQATLGILAGCGSPLFGVELDGGKSWRSRLPGALGVSLWHVPGNCFMGSRRRRARQRSRQRARQR